MRTVAHLVIFLTMSTSVFCSRLKASDLALQKLDKPVEPDGPINRDLIATIETSEFGDGLEDEAAYKHKLKQTLCFVYSSLSDRAEPGCENYVSAEGFSSEELARANTLTLVGQIVKAAKGYAPRFNQMLVTALMTDDLFSSSKKKVTFGQLHTGQGKTLIAAMVALYIKATTHVAQKESPGSDSAKRVAIGILTTNGVLTRQNYAETKAIFEMASEMVKGMKLNVMVFDPEGKGAEGADIIYINPFDLSRDYANYYRSDEREPMLPWHLPDNLEDPNFRSAVIVDEVDAILYDGVGETYLSVRVLPYSEKLALVAEKIAEGCAVQKDFDGAELHRLLGLGEDQPIREGKHFMTSVCEDPAVLESLRADIIREVSIAPSKLAKEQELEHLGKVSADLIWQTGESVMDLLGNDRLYSISDIRKHKTLSSIYDWVVDIFDTRMGKGKGRAYVNVQIRNGRLKELKPVLDWMPSGIGCEVERNDFGLCSQYREFVKAQVDRWLKEARNLLGSQPMLIENRNYMLRGKGLCYHVNHPESPFALPEKERTGRGSCAGFATSLMCHGEAETDLEDKVAEIKTRACANHWLAKLEKVPNENDVMVDTEKQDVKMRVLKLLGMMTGGSKTGGSKTTVKDIRKEVSFSQVIYVEQVSGTIRERTRFNGFKHLFLEYKHNGAVITGPSSETVALSRIRAMEKFNIVLGFTGTLPKEIEKATDLRSVLQQREHSMFVEILKHLYGAGEDKPRLVYVASFVESRMTLKDRLETGVDDKWQQVKQEIESTKTTHCTLLVVEDIGTTYAMANELSKSSDVFQFTGDGRDNKIASMTFEPGQVVVTTAVGSRGVDWHCTAPGGFEVIATFMSKSLRVQRQIQGRAGRSGQKGSYIEIVTAEEVKESLKQWGNAQGHIVKLVKGSLENDLRTDCIMKMSDRVKAAAEVSGNKAEFKKRFDRFRLWMSDSRYNQLSQSLQKLIKSQVENSPDGAEGSLHAFLSELAADLIGDSREQLSVEEISTEIVGSIMEHKLAFEYLFDEVGKNAAYRQYVTECVSEGNCNNIPDFSIL